MRFSLGYGYLARATEQVGRGSGWEEDSCNAAVADTLFRKQKRLV